MMVEVEFQCVFVLMVEDCFFFDEVLVDIVLLYVIYLQIGGKVFIFLVGLFDKCNGWFQFNVWVKMCDEVNVLMCVIVDVFELDDVLQVMLFGELVVMLELEIKLCGVIQDFLIWFLWQCLLCLYFFVCFVWVFLFLEIIMVVCFFNGMMFVIVLVYGVVKLFLVIINVKLLYVISVGYGLVDGVIVEILFGWFSFDGCVVCIDILVVDDFMFEGFDMINVLKYLVGIGIGLV